MEFGLGALKTACYNEVPFRCHLAGTYSKVDINLYSLIGLSEDTPKTECDGYNYIDYART